MDQNHLIMAEQGISSEDLDPRKQIITDSCADRSAGLPMYLLINRSLEGCTKLFISIYESVKS